MNLRSTLRSLTLLFTAGLAQDAAAYANFIGYGYASCLTCHFNAGGNGPLNDYGRALYATAVAGKVADISDEKLAEMSGFLFRKKLGNFRPSYDIRGMFLTSQLNNSISRNSTFIPMQTDANLVYVGMEGQLFGSVTVGADSRRGDDGSRKMTLLSREHYVAYRMENGLSVYAGLLDVLYGLRIPEHTAFSRRNALLSMNDQSHGVMLHLAQPKWEAGIHLLAGNMIQDSDTRLMGVSAMGEFDTWKKGRLGASVAFFTNAFRNRTQASVHLKTRTIGEGSGLIAEFGIMHEANTSPETYTAPYLFIQPVFRLVRGLHLFGIGEYMYQDSTLQFRAGPGLQYFPLQRVELRWDLVTAWNSSGGSPSMSSQLQTHLSF